MPGRQIARQVMLDDAKLIEAGTVIAVTLLEQPGQHLQGGVRLCRHGFPAELAQRDADLPFLRFRLGHVRHS